MMIKKIKLSCCLLVICNVFPIQVQSAKIGPVTPLIYNLNSQDRIADRYIVIYKKSEVSLAQAASPKKSLQMISKEITAELATASGSGLFKRYSSPSLYGSVIHNTNQADVQALYNDPRVDKIYADTKIYPTTIRYSPTWGLDRVDQANLPLNAQYEYYNEGTGVNVFVIDSGIKASHSEFNGNYIPEIDFSEPDNPIEPPRCLQIDDCDFNFIESTPQNTDTLGHGTHVAGTIAGQTYGLATSVNLHSVKIFRNSSTSYSVIIEALSWLNDQVDSNPNLLPMAVNMSYGGTDNNLVAESLYTNLTDKGVILIAAAGNNYSNTCSYPSLYNNVISVGATTINDYKAGFSNYGTCVDLFAPGADIISANINGGSISYNGTSMASPHVTGAVAMYLEGNPNATPIEVKSALLASASNVTIHNAGAGSPNKLLNIRGLDPRPLQIDQYDDIVLRGFTDDVPGDAERLFGDTTQLHNFHDAGDQDWLIFGLPEDGRYGVNTTPLGLASARLEAYQLSVFPYSLPSNPDRFDITMNDLIYLDSDLSNGSNSLVIHNNTEEVQYYVVKVSSSGPSGTNTDYSVSSVNIDPPDDYDNISLRGFTDDVPGDAERLWGNTPQIHNFHDVGDEDWLIFGLGDNDSYHISTTQLGLASARLEAFQLTVFPSGIPNNPDRFEITMNDLILLDSDQSNGDNSLVVHNTTGELQFYVIKVSSSGPFGHDTDYEIIGN
jgi:subtilisin family serine protease